jgi:pyridoxal phosphate enzyme (YggS family)
MMGYRQVMSQVEQALGRVGGDPSRLTVVAVSKGRTVEQIRDVYDQGHRDFGENRARELAEKAPLLPADIRWHFVGPLQTNKVRLVRPVVRLLHSLDRDSLAPAWLKGPGQAPPALVQVNIGREPQRGGIDPDEVEAACIRYRDLGVDVRGVMAIPPIPERAEASRPWFRALRELRDRVATAVPAVTELSMGMTEDFEVAIEEGATLIRPGRAIFGD